MTLVDSHCHLDCIDLARHGGDVAAVLDHAREQGVAHFLCVAIDLEALPEMQRLIAPFNDVSSSVGVHPNVSDGHREPTVDDLLRLAEGPGVVAIGETGLDYFRTGEAGQAPQRARFRRHIAASRASGKPLIVHSRDASEETVHMLQEEGAGEVGGVLHCFTGDWAMAEPLLELGFHISFSGIVTFNSARDIQEVARRMPLERMLVETDSPYLAPVPYRGKGNVPAYVRHVAEFVARIREVETTEIAAATTANFCELFGIHLPLDSPRNVT